MLGDGAHDCRNRRFLECVGADCVSRHLPANDDDWHRIGHAVAHGCNGVGGPRSRGHHDNPDFAAGARVTGCHESGPLFVCGDDQGYGRRAIGPPVLLVVTKDRIVCGQDGATAVAENSVHTLVRQYLHDHVGATHLGTSQRVFLVLLCNLGRSHDVFQKVT